MSFSNSKRSISICYVLWLNRRNEQENFFWSEIISKGMDQTAWRKLSEIIFLRNGWDCLRKLYRSDLNMWAATVLICFDGVMTSTLLITGSCFQRWNMKVEILGRPSSEGDHPATERSQVHSSCWSPVVPCKNSYRLICVYALASTFL